MKTTLLPNQISSAFRHAAWQREGPCVDGRPATRHLATLNGRKVTRWACRVTFGAECTLPSATIDTWLNVEDRTYHTAITRPFLQGDVLYSTNGSVAVSVPITRNENDVDGPVPIEAIKAARALAKAGKFSIAFIDCSSPDVVVLDNGAKYARPAENPPQMSFVMFPKREAGVLKVGLNATFLADAVKAFGGKRVILTFTAGDKFFSDPVTVMPIDEGSRQQGVPGSFAVLVPCIIS